MRKSLLVLGIVLLATPMFAGSITQNGNIVKAQVAAKCVLVSPFTLDFGSYDPVVTNAATALDVATAGANNLQIKCTKNAAFTVDLDNGLSADVSKTNRFMKGAGANTLMYNLYTTNARATVWGSGMTGAAGTTVGGTSASALSNTSITVYGRIPAAQDAAVDATYQDTIVATINF